MEGHSILWSAHSLTLEGDSVPSRRPNALSSSCFRSTITPSRWGYEYLCESNEEAIALIKNRASFQRFKSCGVPANVWQVTPDTILKRLYIPVEPYMMELASSQTSIPIPSIRRCITWDHQQWLLIEYVEGSDLYEIWPSLSLWRKFMLVWTLRRHIQQLRAIELPNKPIQPSGVPLKCGGFWFPDVGANRTPRWLRGSTVEAV
jgi:hypothetical protein